MKNKFNVLILDDNEIISENIKKRISKANSTNKAFSGIEVIPYHLPIDISNLEDSAIKISHFIGSRAIDFLLLDRGFYHNIDPKLNPIYKNLDNDYLYIKKTDLNSGIKIEEILKLINPKEFNRIRGVIIYTYNADSDGYVEPAEIKELYLKEILPEKFSEDNIEIILTNSEIYKLAGLHLYIDKEAPENTELTRTGLKSDFILYGLFMGEILYHRIASLVNKTRQTKIVKKRNLLVKNFIILFFSFTALSIGGNALYAILTSEKTKINLSLFFITIIFSLLIPLFILIVKPELLIDIDNESTEIESE